MSHLKELQHERNPEDPNGFCKLKRVIDKPNRDNIIESHVSNIFKNTDDINVCMEQLEDMFRGFYDMDNTIRKTFYIMGRDDEDEYRKMNIEIYGKLKDTSYKCKNNKKESYCDTNSDYSMTSYTVCILCLILFISVIVILCQKQK